MGEEEPRKYLPNYLFSYSVQHIDAAESLTIHRVELAMKPSFNRRQDVVFVFLSAEKVKLKLCPEEPAIVFRYMSDLSIDIDMLDFQLTFHLIPR